VTVTEAGVPVLRASQSFRMYEIECGDNPGELQTGIAIANPSTTSTATVTLEMTDLNGAAAGRMSTLTIPPGGHVRLLRRNLPVSNPSDGRSTASFDFHHLFKRR